MTGANLVMEYVFSNAAVSRSFTAYLGTAIGATTDKWRITVAGLPKGFNQMDFLAVAIVLVISLCICYRCVDASLLLSQNRLTIQCLRGPPTQSLS